VGALTLGSTNATSIAASSLKITGLANGSSASDAAAFGQIGTAVSAAVSGTTNTLAKFTGANVVGDSSITDASGTVNTTSFDPHVEIIFQDFWKDIVAPGGVLDLDQVKRELADYYDILHEVGKAYGEITGGRFSKPNTAAGHVIDAVNEQIERAVADALVEAPTARNVLNVIAQELTWCRQNKEAMPDAKIYEGFIAGLRQALLLTEVVVNNGAVAKTEAGGAVGQDAANGGASVGSRDGRARVV
jgi:hypothetical protein